jgi:hypothetical protein
MSHAHPPCTKSEECQPKDVKLVAYTTYVHSKMPNLTNYKVKIQVKFSKNVQEPPKDDTCTSSICP